MTKVQVPVSTRVVKLLLCAYYYYYYYYFIYLNSLLLLLLLLCHVFERPITITITVTGEDVAGDLMLLDLVVVRVHCIVCIVCDWRSHDYLVVRI